MRGVALIGDKGGCGKTTLAHCLALGACWKNVPTHFMHTDNRRPIRVQGRPYMYYDARDPDALKALINSACNTDGLCVIDGGGNRPQFDLWVAQAMDLVVIPVTPDPEDVVVAVDHMARLEGEGITNVRFLLNKVSSNRHEKAYVAKYLAKVPEDRTIGWIPKMEAVRVLREPDDDAFPTPPSKVNNLSRNLYTTIAYYLNTIESNVEKRQAA